MSIEARLDEALKEAMRSRDSDRVACVRQVRSKIQEAQNQKDFSGPADDAFYQRVIGAYVKTLRKGIGELSAAGERGETLRQKYQAEIEYLQQFLPKLLDEVETTALVEETLRRLNVEDPKQAGRIMGEIMKNHKGEVDAALVRRLVDEKLASPT